jgi:hypothetical protein
MSLSTTEPFAAVKLASLVVSFLTVVVAGDFMTLDRLLLADKAGEFFALGTLFEMAGEFFALDALLEMAGDFLALAALFKMAGEWLVSLKPLTMESSPSSIDGCLLGDGCTRGEDATR